MTAKRFDFDEEIDRREAPTLKVHPIVLGTNSSDLFPAGVADMDFKAPPPILEAMEKRLCHSIFGYEAVPEGLFPALTGWFAARHGWDIDPGHILRAPNVLNSLAIAASLFTEEGDGIIVQSPVFFDFFDVIEENRRRVVPNPLVIKDCHYEIEFDSLEQLAAEPRTRMLFLCNPHNPVGRVWGRDELERLGDICRRHDVLVVSDEIHADITFSDYPYTPFASLSEADAQNCITCLSPAKSFNIASCCSAFTVIADEEKRAAFQAENSRLTVNKNNAFASVAMEAAYKSGGPWLDAALDYIAGNLKLVRERLAALPTVTLIEPEGTFLVWIDFRDLGLTPNELTAFLRNKARCAVTRGEAFGEGGQGFARVNIACTRAKLTTALDRLHVAVMG
jgi:cysteine-S-conjugate beta-lyase